MTTRTTTGIKKCSFDFEFPDFSQLSLAEPGSSSTSAAVELLGRRWRLHLYAGGHDEASKTFVGCFLQCRSAGTVGATTVSFRMSVANHRSTGASLIKAFEATHTFKQFAPVVENDTLSGSDLFGWPQFVSRALLREKAREFLVSDTLLVRLEIVSVAAARPSPVELVQYSLSALQRDERTVDVELHVALPVFVKDECVVDCDSNDNHNNDNGNSDANNNNNSNNNDKDCSNAHRDGYFDDSDDNNAVAAALPRNTAAIKTHKLVLSAFSEVFKTIFYGPPTNTHMGKTHNSGSKLVIEGFSLKAVQSVVDFCYGAEIAFTGFSLADVLEALRFSCEYQIQALSARCVVYLLEILSEGNAIEILKAVHTHSLVEAKEEVINFIADHPNSPSLNADALQNCDKELLIEIVLLRSGPTNKGTTSKRTFSAI